ncbi:hypothetical protein [Escherichia coli]|uniref:hypothetical protein n=1 Tax=Escherichia coli TaxID=562 RepID=UPI0016006949|nr:hypothetical protein [Escherichia coli]
MMSLWDALRMNMMISYQELVRTFPNKMKLRIFFEIKMSIPLPRILVRLTVSVSLSLMKPRAKIGDYVMVLQKITEKGGNIG